MSVIAGKERARQRIFKLNPNVFFLGIVSFFTDVSSEMIFTLVPLFLSNVLGAGGTIVGVVGGLSESIDSILRIFSGWFSDKIGRRKSLALAGYSISTLVKPFMYLASVWGIVLAVRFGDRLGKGIRTAPRDALIADSVTPGERGRGFGLHRAMDTMGAAVGLILAAVIVYTVQGGGLQLQLKTYQWLVIAGTVPAVMAVLLLIIFVREQPKDRSTTGTNLKPTSMRYYLTGYDNRFKVFLTLMAVFTLGNSSDFFVILRAQNLDVSLINVVLMLVVFNITYAAVSIPAGILSDRLGRRRVITFGWFIYAMVYLGFAMVSSTWLIWLLFACYGIYYGVVEGVAKAFVADLVAPDKRGTAYGLYHAVLSLLPASLIAGWLWDAVNPAAPFLLGSGFAFLAMLGLLVFIRE